MKKLITIIAGVILGTLIHFLLLWISIEAIFYILKIEVLPGYLIGITLSIALVINLFQIDATLRWYEQNDK
tara:strand:+ start:225 stop:437 length:213 start_codon:yes stop_codon:yes gene_type:complete